MPSLDLRSPARLLGRAPDLRWLLGAGLVSMSGDWLLSVGLAYSVYALTGSTLASAAALLSAVGPQVLGGSMGGVRGAAAVGVRPPGAGREHGRRLRRPVGPQADHGGHQPAPRLRPPAPPAG